MFAVDIGAEDLSTDTPYKVIIQSAWSNNNDNLDEKNQVKDWLRFKPTYICLEFRWTIIRLTLQNIGYN